MSCTNKSITTPECTISTGTRNHDGNASASIKLIPPSEASEKLEGSFRVYCP